MVRRLLSSTLALCCLWALSGCQPVFFTPNDHDLDAAEIFEVTPPEEHGYPLPAGAIMERAGDDSVASEEIKPVEGSLRPDSASAEERIPEILKRGRIIVGVDQSQHLLSYIDPVTGSLKGFEVDLAKEIARDIFGDPEAVDFRFLSSSERIAALKSRQVDIVIRTMTITAKRQEEVQFSTPYLTATNRMLVLRDTGIEGFEDLPGKTVCTVMTSTSLDRAHELAPESNILKTRRWADCMLALQVRQVDAVMTDDAILAGFAAQDAFAEIVGTPSVEGNYGVAVRKPSAGDDPSGLVRQVNETMERIRIDGTWHRLYQSWFHNQLTVNHMPPADYRDEP